MLIGAQQISRAGRGVETRCKTAVAVSKIVADDGETNTCGELRPTGNAPSSASVSKLLPKPDM